MEKGIKVGLIGLGRGEALAEIEAILAVCGEREAGREKGKYRELRSAMDRLINQNRRD